MVITYTSTSTGHATPKPYTACSDASNRECDFDLALNRLDYVRMCKDEKIDV